MEEQKFQMDFAGRPLVIEVGKLAKQASGAALVRYGDTAVFVTATGRRKPVKMQTFSRSLSIMKKRCILSVKSPAALSNAKGNRLNRQRFSLVSSTARSVRSSRKRIVMTFTSWLMISA